MSGTADVGREVGNKADQDTGKDGDREEGAELINDGVEFEDAGEVKDGDNDDGSVEAPVSRAVVLEHLAVLMGERLAISPDTGQQAVARTLEDEEAPIDQPRVRMGECMGVDEVVKVSTELLQGLAFFREGKVAVVLGSANPHVPHEKREKYHEGECTQAAAELHVTGHIDLGVHARLPAVKHLLGLGRGSSVPVGFAVRVAIGVSIAENGLGLAAAVDRGDWR